MRPVDNDPRILAVLRRFGLQKPDTSKPLTHVIKVGDRFVTVDTKTYARVQKIEAAAAKKVQEIRAARLLPSNRTNNLAGWVA
jgi:hypothetical protein